MKRLHLILAIALLGLGVAGCAPLKPASPSMFFGNCITPPGPDLCDSDQSICQNFVGVISQKHATAAACTAACNQVYNSLYYQQYDLRSCGGTLDRANDLCQQECLRQYPAQK